MAIDKEKVTHRLNGMPWLRLLILGVCFTLLLLAGVRYVLRLPFFQSKDAIEARVAAAEARAKEFEEKAAEAERKAGELETRLVELNAKVQSADQALESARNIRVTVRQKYDEVRNSNTADYSGDAERLCAELARLGISCTAMR